MKNLKVTSLICGGILSLTGSSLLAQQSSTTSPSSSSSSLNSQSSSGSTLDQGASSQSSSSLGSSSSAYGSSSSSMSSGNNVRLSQLMNTSVQSREGKSLGQIRDLIVDPQSGRIQFAILSLSSAGAASDTSTSGRETVPSSRSSVTGTPSTTLSSSMTGKMVPVPWQLFSQGWDSSHAGSSATTSSSTLGSSSSLSGHPLVLNIDESKLQSAPSFDASNWNELQSIDHRAYSHFGVDRSSGYGRSGSSISGSSSDHSSPGSSSGSKGTSGHQGTSGLQDSTTPRSNSSSTDK